MVTKKDLASNVEKLRVSPGFSLSFTSDGRPYVAQDCEPYLQFWLSDLERTLWTLFTRRGGERVSTAVELYAKFTNKPVSPQLSRKLMKVISDMHDAGVLLVGRGETSRYDKTMAEDYLRYRPFPTELAQQIIRDGNIQRQSEVLDLAGGPGDLAIQLASTSDHVTLMELSRGFTQMASKRAAAAGLKLDLLQESCNRLIYSSEAYDVVTVSQALHWLDDVSICRALQKNLSADGHFFVIQAAFDLSEDHPLAYFFGRNSILGPAPEASFEERIEALQKRLSLMFAALHASASERVDTTGSHKSLHHLAQIWPAKASLYKQARPIGMGFARAFLSDAHIAPTGMSPKAFWQDLESRCEGVSERRLMGHMNWAVLHFSRATSAPASSSKAPKRQKLAYHGPAEAGIGRGRTA